MKKIFTFLLIGFAFLLSYGQQSENTLVVHADKGELTINKNIYGHFAEHLGKCVYGGIWVGEDSPIPNTRGIRNDIIEAMKEISVPVIRWPGGCFADIYHWRDGVGPKEERPEMINWTWGRIAEDNSFGTAEFLDFCDLIGAEPYLAINVGSGTVQEATDWVDYVTAKKGPMAELRKSHGREEPWKVKYWGIGNESWGCGGNMTPEFYTDLFKQYSTFSRGRYKIISGGINNDLNWTETVMKKTREQQNLVRGYSYHYYTICHDWSKKGSATDFNADEWFNTMFKTNQVDNNLTEHTEIMNKYDPDNKIALIADEWGNWFDTKKEMEEKGAYLYQQNTLRDAVTAGLYLNIFNKHCERVRMANIAQTVNVLQAVILTNEEQMVKTPTFYVFKMYKVHQDATLLPFDLESTKYVNSEKSMSALSVSASKDAEGKIHISIVNLDPGNEQKLKCTIEGANFKNVSGKIITASEMKDYNDFGTDEKVNIKEFKNFSVKKEILEVKLPAKSVVMLELKE